MTTKCQGTYYGPEQSETPLCEIGERDHIRWKAAENCNGCTIAVLRLGVVNPSGTAYNHCHDGGESNIVTFLNMAKGVIARRPEFYGSIITKKALIERNLW